MNKLLLIMVLCVLGYMQYYLISENTRLNNQVNTMLKNQSLIIDYNDLIAEGVRHCVK